LASYFSVHSSDQLLLSHVLPFLCLAISYAGLWPVSTIAGSLDNGYLETHDFFLITKRSTIVYKRK